MVTNLSTVWKPCSIVTEVPWNTTHLIPVSTPQGNWSGGCGNCTEGGTPSRVLPLAMKAVLAPLMVLMIFVSIVGNSIVCLIVYRKPAMRSAINLLLANMAFSNIMLGLLCMPFALVTLLMDDWIFGVVLCRSLAFLHTLLVCEAVCILLSISVDRYLIIVLRKDKLTQQRARLLLYISWCVSACLSFPPTLGWGLYTHYNGWVQCILEEYRNPADMIYILFVTCAIFFLPMFIMTYVYLCICKTVRRNSLRIHNHPESVDVSQMNKLGLATMGRQPKVTIDMSFKTRAFKTILILYVLFVCCWMPYAVLRIVWNLTGQTGANYIGGTVILWLGYMNSAMNPIIYCWRIKKFREACRDLVPKKVKLIPKLPSRAKRRINPSSAYECGNEQQSTV